MLTKKSITGWILALTICTYLIGPAAGQQVLYVDCHATGANNGSSWQDAYTYLQDALRAAEYGDEIWVVRCIYKPDQSSDNPTGSGERDATFRLQKGVAVYGGFPAGGAWEDRNPQVYETILSGDLNSNDQPGSGMDDPTKQDNSYHVVTASGTDFTTVLDGFTITCGNANGSGFPKNLGGGMYADAGSPTIVNCKFEQNLARTLGGGLYNNNNSNSTLIGCTFNANRAEGNGGGMYCGISEPTLTDCHFIGNSASRGGGMYNAQGNAKVCDCNFTGNSAGFGGGIYSSYSNPMLVNCYFNGNEALDAFDGGGGIYNSHSEPTLVNCVFCGNKTKGSFTDGGGIYNTTSNPTLTNCTFSGNSAPDFGGGMYNSSSSPILTNCTFFGNRASRGGGMASVYASGPKVTNCVFWGNSDGGPIDDSAQIDGEAVVNYSDVHGGWSGAGGTGNINAGPQFADADGPDNILGTEDDNLRLLSGSPCIDAGDNRARPLFGVDADLNVRRFDDSATPDRGRGDSPAIDMGAYEWGSPSIPARLYVDGQDGGANIGTNWADAFGDLQMALQTALVASKKVSEIWVAAGTYTPAQALDDRTATFRMVNDVSVFGGFAGNEDPATFNLEERNFDANETILSGDLKGDDGLRFVNNGENCYRVVTASNVNSAATLDGFTVSGGNADGDNDFDSGAGLYISNGCPSLQNCRSAGNSASSQGGGLHSICARPTFANLTVVENIAPVGSGGVILDNEVNLQGAMQLTNCMLSVTSSLFDGPGPIDLSAGATLKVTGRPRGAVTIIRSDITGTGTVDVGLNSELIVEREAVLNLGGGDTKGTVQCQGLLRARDRAQIINANVNVTRVSFEGEVNIFNSVITAEAGVPYGQFFIEDSVTISGNEIHADGDRYMDMDPSVFDGLVEKNQIYVSISEGKGQTRGGLLELRGQEDLVAASCEFDEFLCRADPGTIPDFNANSWTLQELKLEDGAKLNLTNRFDFQPPYDFGGDDEALYVRDLILGEGAILNAAYNRIYYENMYVAETAIIENVPLLGFSLNIIAFDDNVEFSTRITHNNLEHPDDDGEYDRIHVRRITGLDPNGMMVMCNLEDRNPGSPNYGDVINARAKGLFAKSSEDQILVLFDYLFGTSDIGVELVVYLSDVPELLDHNDPRRADHYIEVARLPAPPPSRPGSSGSNRFGTFQKYVSRGHLDFVKGTRIELELIGPEGTCALINNWDPQVHCYGICLDVTMDNFVNVVDLMTVIAECGLTAELLPDGTNSRDCLDGVFSSDGYVDSYDLMSWDWMLNSEDRKNLCEGLPLSRAAGTASVAASMLEASAEGLSSIDIPDYLSDLLIVGKRSASRHDPGQVAVDRLYVFDSDGVCAGYSSSVSDHCNIRLVRGPGADFYQINSEIGVLKLNEPNAVIIPSGQTTYSREPRYSQSATVYVGIQGEGADLFGRPILDAAFDEDYVYVVPVVINPDGNEPYVAAAKLRLLESGDPPFQVVQLYDDPPPEAENQRRSNLREIEIDDEGNLYVVNVHSLNESDILWKYSPNGTALKRLDLGKPGSYSYLPDPIGMYVSEATDTVYLASAQYNPEDPNSTVVYGFSSEDLALKWSTVIDGVHHVTSITEDPAARSLWVVGFNMEDIPEYPSPTAPPFYHPYLAQVSYDSNDVRLLPLSDPDYHDLALPLSVVWTGGIPSCFPSSYSTYNDWVALGKPNCWCGPYQCDGDAYGGTETFFKYRIYGKDLGLIVDNWRRKIDDPELDPCADIDHKPETFFNYRVYGKDLATVVANWKKKDSDLAGDCPRPE